jgi:adenylate kinase family enzyme
MPERRIVIYGNSGSGKTTMARRLAEEFSLPCLPLDGLAWAEWAVRKPLPEAVKEIDAFMDAHPQWVMEGCYADLIEPVLPRCTELRFLNPGVTACINNCRSRPWEPDKYPSMDAQNEMLDTLIAWVQDYDTRPDDCGLPRHRQLFDSFPGPKKEFT